MTTSAVPNLRQGYLFGLLFLFLSQAMVAVNIVYSKLILVSLPMISLLTLRFGIATIVLLPLHWITQDKSIPLKAHFAKLGKKDWVFIFANALTAGVLFNLFMMLGLCYTDANIAGIIASALPAIIAALSLVFLGESLTKKKSLCIGLATIGLVVIALGKLKGVSVNHSIIGDLIVLIALIPEASYYVMAKLYQPKLPVFILSSLINGIAFVFFALAMYFSDTPSLTAISLSHWFILFVLGLSAGLFYVFWIHGSKQVDGLIASLATAIMPVIAAILAWIVLREALSASEFLGMVLVLLSIVVSAKR